jgi:hypothetical protein
MVVGLWVNRSGFFGERMRNGRACSGGVLAIPVAPRRGLPGGNALAWRAAGVASWVGPVGGRLGPPHEREASPRRRPTSHSTGRRCSAVATSATPRPGAGEFPR